MTNDEKLNLQYRFSGYQPPLVQLDATGAAYWVNLWVHPYYVNQPESWSRRGICAPAGWNVASGAGSSNQDVANKNLYPLLPVCKK